MTTDPTMLDYDEVLARIRTHVTPDRLADLPDAQRERTSSRLRAVVDDGERIGPFDLLLFAQAADTTTGFLLRGVHEDPAPRPALTIVGLIKGNLAVSEFVELTNAAVAEHGPDVRIRNCAGGYLLYTTGALDPFACWCGTCESVIVDEYDRHDQWYSGGFIVCPVCGNKRCPRATHHDHACSGSNSPGQPGSDF